MVDERLRSYVEKAARHNADKETLRHTLLVSGWPRKGVDYAISEAYRNSPNKSRSKGLIVLIALLAVIVLIGVILLVSRAPIAPRGDSNTITGADGNEAPLNKCALETTDEAKDLCYQELAAQGFDCGSLTDEVEKSFCFRALEYYLVS